MAHLSRKRKKREIYKWSKVAIDMVRASRGVKGPLFRQLISRLASESGHPRDACLRFARSNGVSFKHKHNTWGRRERERLLEMLDESSVREAAARMHRSPGAIYSILRRLQIGVRGSQNSWSKLQLAKALHCHSSLINRWIANGWLKCRVETVGKLSYTRITSDDFYQFCKKYSKIAVGNRLTEERLKFVSDCLFPTDHNRLLAVRASKKERAAIAQHEPIDGAGSDDDCDDQEEITRTVDYLNI